MGNQAGIIIRNVKNELFHSAKRLILNEVKGIECLLTIIGIPIALQTFKIGLLCLWPFGSTVRDTKSPTGCCETMGRKDLKKKTS